MWDLTVTPRDHAEITGLSECSCFVHIARLGCRHGSYLARSNTAQKHPPARELPSAPAGGYAGPYEDVSELLGVVVDHERRRGRGAQSNASGRYEPLARIAFDDGWRSPRRIAAVQDAGDDRRNAQDHHPQRLARHRLRPLDQSLSRLRARLHLLLRAPDACLSRPVARARFRIQAVRQAGSSRPPGKGIVGARLRAEGHRDRHQYRPLSADRAALQSDAPHPRSARPRRPPGRHRHQVGAGAARPRHSRAHGRAQARQGRAVGDHARSPSSRARWSRARRRRCGGWRRCGGCRRPACRPP